MKGTLFCPVITKSAAQGAPNAVKGKSRVPPAGTRAGAVKHTAGRNAQHMIQASAVTVKVVEVINIDGMYDTRLVDGTIM